MATRIGTTMLHSRFVWSSASLQQLFCQGVQLGRIACCSALVDRAQPNAASAIDAAPLDDRQRTVRGRAVAHLHASASQGPPQAAERGRRHFSPAAADGPAAESLSGQQAAGPRLTRPQRAAPPRQSGSRAAGAGHPDAIAQHLAATARRTGRAAGEQGASRAAQPEGAAAADRAAASAAARGLSAQRARPPPPPTQEETVDMSHVYSEAAVTELGPNDVNRYYCLTPERIPEAFLPFYAEAAKRRESVTDKGGCKGLRDEYSVTGSEHVMFRRCMRELIERVASGEGKRGLYLDGPPGAGKSIALAALVDWARAAGWLVVYLPSAAALMHGGFYLETEEGGAWDTPDAAKTILRSVSAAHGDMLAGLSVGGSGTLADVVTEGLEAQMVAQPHVAVDAVLRLLEELSRTEQVKVLLAVDDYNALYGRSRYGLQLDEYQDRPLDGSELRLAAAFRLLERWPPASGAVVAAAGHSMGVPRSIRVPLTKLAARVQVERFDGEEVERMLEHYAVVGALAAPADPAATHTLLHLTAGNAREIRDMRGAWLGI